MIHFTVLEKFNKSLCQKPLMGRLFATNENLVDCPKCLELLGKKINDNK